MPVPRAIIEVSVTLFLERTCPTARVPDVTSETERYVAEAFIAVGVETVWDGVIVYVSPEPPVMTVPAVTPGPVMTCPTASVPELTEVTVRVVVEIVPVKAATAAGAVALNWADATVCELLRV